MASIWEKPKSQSGDVPFFGQTSTSEFGASGYANESDLVAAIVAASTLIPSFKVVNGQSLFIEKFSYREFAGGCWDVTAHYRGQRNEWKLAGDTSGGTRKRFYSLETVNTYDCVQTLAGPPDMKGAIGVTDNGIDGVDVPDEKFDFTITQNLSLTSLSSDYLQLLRTMTGTVNDYFYTVDYEDQRLEFEEEELRLMGINFEQSSSGDLSISYKFSAQDSILEEDDEVIGESAAIEKKGWQYIWVYFQQFHDVASHSITRKPIAAYVERVCKLSDFTMLAIS
jgi:hypothetical protein